MAAEIERTELNAAYLEQSIARCFEAQADAHAQRLAVCGSTAQLTYGELNVLANRQAHALLERNTTWEQPVALLLDQGTPFISALLGVLKAGGFCVPLDPSNPPARNVRMLQDAGARRLITNQRNLPLAREIIQENCELIDVDALSPQALSLNPDLPVAPTALACVLYTSGATGQPNGVMHDHRTLLHNVMRHSDGFGITSNDRQTLLYTCSAYGGLRDILNALLNGASLHTFPLKQNGVEGLAEWLCDSRITIYCSVATVFRQLVETLTGREEFPDLRFIKLGGEASHRSDVDRYRNHFPATCRLHCGLSTTETGVARQFFIDHDTSLSDGAVPLGFPVEDVEVQLLDAHSVPVARGEIGEIVIRSRYISRGYLRRPDLNATVLAADTQHPEIRIYRTGDLGVLRSDDCLEHRGRKDAQVKIRGNRIELPAIETALRRLSAVAHAAVIARRDAREETYLVAYVVARGAAPEVGALRAALAARLPDYMIPSAFVWLDHLPQTPDGKIDHQALPAPDASRPDLARVYRAPQTALESSLAALWSDLLGISRVGVEDDFFDLGGNSIIAVRLMAQIRAQHGRSLPISLLFEARTVQQLATVIARGHDQSAWSPLVPIRPSGRRAPLFCIHPGGGNVLGYQEFIGHLDADQPAYGLQAYGVVEGQEPHVSVAEMARLYVRAIREVQPHGAYYLGGESFGGLVAYEMACQLSRAGEQVAFLFLGDVWSVNVPHFRRWRYALSCLSYPMTLSWAEWRAFLARKLRKRGLATLPPKRYTYADELHRRNSLAHRRAAREYRPGRFPGRITLFRAREQNHRTRRLQHYFGGAPMCWEALVERGVDVHWMPDVHHEMMHGANARGFARVLQECLDSARRNLEIGSAAERSAPGKMDEPLIEPNAQTTIT
jgi:amino acid adenylation domain-containing protein